MVHPTIRMSFKQIVIYCEILQKFKMLSRMWFNYFIQIFADSDRSWDTLFSLTHTQNQKNAELKIAVEKGDENATVELLRRGADANDTDTQGYTCIHHAVLRGHHRLIKYLVEFGADIEKNIVYGARLKPIHLVAYSENKSECLQELLEHEVIIDSKCRSGNTLLQLLVKWATSDIELIEKILALGLDPNVVDQAGNNCMHLLAGSKSSKTEILAAMFLKKGINIDCKKRTNETPLHIACRRGNTCVVDLLLRAGADVDVVDTKGCYAFDNISTSKVFSVFVKHLVLRMKRGSIVAERFQKKIKSTESYEEFVQDLNRLKLERVSRSFRITYYDFLCGKISDVAKYLKNTEIREKISQNYNHVSTMYKKEIHARFEEAIRLCEHEEYAYRITDMIFGEILPHLCVVKIAGYLGPNDLQGMSCILEDR